MKNIDFKNILLISLMAYILHAIAFYLSCLDYVDSNRISSINDYNFSTLIGSFLLILIFFIPIQIILKYINISFKRYLFLTICILQVTIFFHCYGEPLESFSYSTYETGAVFIATFIDSFWGITISSALFFIFLKWYLKPNNGKEV